MRHTPTLHVRGRPAGRGQSMVEFALIAPLLTLLVFGIVELGILFNIYVSLTNAAREAAREASIYQETTPLTSTSDATAMDTRRLQVITTAISDTVSPAIDRSQIQVTVSYTPTAVVDTNLYRSGTTIAVQLNYRHPLFFGMLGDQEMPLRATSAMRIEPGGTR